MGDTMSDQDNGTIMLADPRLMDDLVPMSMKAPILIKRTPWVKLIAPYEGFELRCWVNFPRRIRTQFQNAKNEEEVLQVLQIVVLEHNGWLKEDGEPMPPPSSAEFWELMPDETFAIFLSLFREEIDRIPNSLQGRNLS